MQNTNDYRSRTRTNPYAQQDDAPTSYENAAIPSTTNLTGGSDGMTAFYSEVRASLFHSLSSPVQPRGKTAAPVLRGHRTLKAHPAWRLQISSIQDDIRTFNDNVNRISDMHSRSLNTTDDAASQRVNQQLEDLVADTSALSDVLRRRIKALQKQGGAGRDGEIRKQQVCGAIHFLRERYAE